MKRKAILRFIITEIFFMVFLAWLNWYWIHTIPLGFTFCGVYLLIYPIWYFGTLFIASRWIKWYDYKEYEREKKWRKF